MDNKFKKIISKVFKKKFNRDMSIDNTPEWDSLNFVTLITLLEKNYGKKVKDKDIVKLINVKKIYEFFKKKH